MLPGKIAPSMMCANMLQLEDDIRALEKAQVEFFHIDIMDNHFVPNITLSPDFAKLLRKNSKIPLDVHLMIENPEKSISIFDFQPGEYVTVHYESTPHIHRALSAIKDTGAHAGIALNPGSPLSLIEDLICDIDMLLLMTVNPGFAGQKLIESGLTKIEKARKMLDDAGREDILLEVDGNVSFENAKKMRAAGADTFVAGSSSVFRNDLSIAQGVEELRKCIQ